ncbi:MAG: hypothetical protein QNK27_06825 [Desulfuromusa sp.]|nr:hypothetical protein [Desulfuromusa sp.]
MIHINTMDDLDSIRDDPELWREAYGFLSVCAYEIQEYGDEEDLLDHNFNMVLLDEQERGYINDLGSAEETALTRIEFCGEVRIFRRLVYATEIILIEESAQ